ncbi:NADPH2:quinone reductase [Sanguibacter gelidistatuariae]|uniref:NADPH2:quinone reductase n=1 Tax=Sanguibacter gelidistatuariae TaxID=1814289 RepID=A0A1G6P343_9MICO|nr:quinone oxidoreductase [Sanguibacter gelidistatuariae]SDC74479.1 NADPH2:quinone reductase [Sanguibacter gelidistatuariae]
MNDQTTTHAIVATRAGGPEVLELREIPVPSPGDGELLVEVAAAGVNFIDTYRRSGVYRIDYPSVLGTEGAGVVVATGSDAGGFTAGDRVAWSDAPRSYAGHVIVRAERALPVPPGIDLQVAAALPLQGMTAHYLATSTYPIAAGDQVLIHAGAGGVGLLLTQLAVARGATVITTVSTEAKADLSRGAGAHHVINYRELTDLTTELPALVRELAGGGVHVAYDSVGKDTFDASLASLRRRGMLVLFGGSSGQVPPFDIQRLNAAGSAFLTRPTLGDYVATRAELLSRAEELFAAVRTGQLNVRIGATFPLTEAAAAHTALEGRRTTGKVLLLP